MTKFTGKTLENRRPGASTVDFIRVGMSTCGLAAGARDTYDLFAREIKNRGLNIELRRCGCAGMCYAEPLAEVSVNGMEPCLYGGVNTETAVRILESHIQQKVPVSENIYRISDRQTRIVLRNSGIIDPESIDDYLDREGYRGLLKVLSGMTPEQVIEELKTSGLRGRGGAGFPTWMKWSFAARAKGKEKFIICNGDEGDPGAYMDRSILEGDPHSIIEGLTIGAYAMGATKGFVYIRAEYPLAILRIETALEQARECGLLGSDILGRGFSFDIEIRLGAGAFVCGEETALITSIEGKRGTPSPRPPFPTERGLWDMPTCINNVETLANIAPIISKGGNWFASTGTEKSRGTKVFALTGKVAGTGLIEIAMGTPLRDIVYEIGGGSPSGKKIIAVQTGGPSGGMIPEKLFDTPVSYEDLQSLGSIMGSGGMIVMDEDDCVIDIARFYLGFCVDESCGKCAPCRIGGKQMLGLLEKITSGQGQDRDMERIKSASLAMCKASLCGLGQSAPNPVLSSLRYFEQEYMEHIHDKKCRAKRCSNLLSFKIIQEKCKRCGVCVRNCPVGAIRGDRALGYLIDEVKCIKCGRCFEVCKFEAITRG